MSLSSRSAGSGGAGQRRASPRAGRHLLSWKGVMDVSAATSAPDADLPVIAFANRLPVRRTRNGWRLSDGGLVAALRPAMRSRGGVWVGWDGGAEMPAPCAGARLRAAARSRSRGVRSTRTTTASPTGRCGRCSTAWSSSPRFERAWWDVYRRVNERFADGRRPGDAGLRWVHDYHLLLAARAAPARGRRSAGSGSSCTSRSRRRRCSRGSRGGRAVLDGMLGADVVSFHTERYRDNFLRTCAQLLDDVARRGDDRCDCTTGGVVRTAAHPISIDAARLRASARSSRRRARARRPAGAVRRHAASSSASTGSTTRRGSRSGCARSSCCSSCVRSCARGSRSSRSPCRAGARSASTGSCAPHGRAARRPDQRPLHRARPGRARPLPLPRRHPGPAARLLPRSPTSAS